MHGGCRQILFAVYVLSAVAAAPRAAWAFWPLTRTFVDAKPDSAQQARIETRWAKFQQLSTAPARADSVAAVPGGPQTFISRATSNEPVGGDAGAAGTGSGADGVAGTGGAAGTATGTGNAAADSTVAPAMPFPELIRLAREREAALAAGDSAAADSIAAVGGLPGGTGTAGGTGGTGGTGATPAAQAAAAALAKRMAEMAGWQPVLTSKMTLNSDTQDTSVDMRSAFTDPSGVTLSNSLGYRNVLSLLRKQELDTRTLGNSLTVPLRAKGVTFSMSTTNTKSSQVSQASTGNALDTSSNTKAAQVSLQVSRKLLELPGLSQARAVFDGLAVNGSVALDYGASRNDQTTTARVGSSTNKHEGSGRGYGAGASFDRLRWMSLRVRTGRLRRDNDDSIEQIRQVDAPAERSQSTTKSAGDTTSVDLSIPAAWKLKTVTVGFRTANGVDTRPENATGITGTPQGTGFQFETTRTFSRGFTLAAKLQPVARLDMSLTAGASRDSTGYKIKRLSFTDTQKYNWKLENHLQIWGTGILTANYESSVADVDRDAFNTLTSSLELSPQTRVDKMRKLYTEYARDWTATLKTKLSYEVQLDRGEFTHPGTSGGLSDLDQLRTRAALDFSGQMANGATGMVTMYYRTLDKAYIDPTQSSLSKNESEYVVRPSYTWPITARASVSQRFSLESKVLDDVFRPENSTLDRNHTMNTSLKYDLTSRLHFDAQYDYGLQDNGSYVELAGVKGRSYTPQNRTKKDQIQLNTRCDVLREGKLAFVSQQVSTRTRRLSHVSTLGTSAITESNALTLGLESKLELRGAKLDCRIRWTSNNFSGNQREYADGNASFEWTF